MYYDCGNIRCLLYGMSINGGEYVCLILQDVEFVMNYLWMGELYGDFLVGWLD